MSDNLSELLFVPLATTIVTALIAGVVLLLARQEAKDAAKTTPPADALLERMRKAG